MSLRSQLLPASLIQHSTLECCHDMHHLTDISSHFSFCFLLLIRSDDEAFHFHVLWMIPQPSFSSENVNNVHASMEHAQESERICTNVKGMDEGWRGVERRVEESFSPFFLWFILHSFFCSVSPFFIKSLSSLFKEFIFFSFSQILWFRGALWMGERRAHVKNSDEWWAEVGEHTQKHSKKEEIRKNIIVVSQWKFLSACTLLAGFSVT